MHKVREQRLVSDTRVHDVLQLETVPGEKAITDHHAEAYVPTQVHNISPVGPFSCD